MGLIVDSSVFIDAERRSRVLNGDALSKVLASTGEADLAVSVVTLAELAFGHAQNPLLSEKVKVAALEDIRVGFPVLPVTAGIAIRAGNLNAILRQRGIAIGFADVLIAATSLEIGFGVFTHNVRHFSYIPGLRVLDAAQF